MCILVQYSHLRDFVSKIANLGADANDSISMSIFWFSLSKLNVNIASIFTPQLANKAHQLGCPKIVLDHMHVYIYII